MCHQAMTGLDKVSEGGGSHMLMQEGGAVSTGSLFHPLIG